MRPFAESPDELPGYKKKSFAMSFQGGDIWFEHLDGLYEFTELVFKKLNADKQIFLKPSMPSLIAVNLDETIVTDTILDELVHIFSEGNKRICRVAFVGLGKKEKKQLKKKLNNDSVSFAYDFIDDFEKSKEWLVSEKY